MTTATSWQVAFERLYEANRELVFNYSRGILRATEDAEDCTVETFEEALKAMKKGQVMEPSRAWLLTVAKHRAYRKSKAKKWFANLDDHTELASAEFVDRRFLDEAEVKSLLADLSREEQESIWMHDGLGLTHQEIGDIIGVPLGTVLARVFRGRKKVQRKLGLEGTSV